ncbi:MAG: divalent-cation tolerance protein CutA [Cyanobacteria bacterium P01_H01_bin.74]
MITSQSNSNAPCVALITCSSKKEAEDLSATLIKRKQAACVNIFPVESGNSPVQLISVYQWDNTIQQDAEILLVVKTTINHLTAIEDILNKMHSYDVPELIALPIIGGSKAYLDWLQNTVAETPEDMLPKGNILE